MSARNQGSQLSSFWYFLPRIARNLPKMMITLQLYLLLLVICQLRIAEIASYNLSYHSESILMSEEVFERAAKCRHNNIFL